MRFVPVKTDDQLDLQAVHRVRARLVGRRTAVIRSDAGCACHLLILVFQVRFRPYRTHRPLLVRL